MALRIRKSITSDGASEHDYSLRPSDVKRRARTVVWVGGNGSLYGSRSGISDNKQVTIAQLADVKLPHEGGADDDEDEHAHTGADEEKVTYITITANTSNIFGCSPEIAGLRRLQSMKLSGTYAASRGKLDANLRFLRHN